MRARFFARAGFGIACVLPLLAQAHAGGDAGSHHGMSFASGLLHPFTGLDHLCAMLAVGVWSALVMRGRQVWAAPVAFAAMLLIGALLGMTGEAGVMLSTVEPMIAASLLVLGLLVATRRALPLAAAAALVGGFALFHGVAHGSELVSSASAAAALSGMLLGTVALHLAGVVLGLQLQSRQVWLSRVAGAGVAAFGATLLLPMAAQAI